MSDVPGGPPPALIDILLSSLEALVAQGQADAACRFAGEACAALRGRDLASWRRFNVFLHRNAKYVSMEDVPESKVQ